jgi:hypothetical protein
MQVIQYEVGKDVTQERYDAILAGVITWFKEYRPNVDHEREARHALECCLRGVQLKDGKTPWSKMAKASFEVRVRMATRFDPETMEPRRVAASPGVKTARVKQNARAKELRRIMTDNPTYPSKPKNPDEPKYGENPLSMFSDAELLRRDKLRQGFLDDFPQLSSVAAQAKLDMLLDLTLLMDRLRFRQLKEQSVTAIEEQLSEISKQILALEKALNIHPDQVAKQQREKEGGSVGEAARKLDEAVPYEVRERWFAEELIMMYQMYHQRSPRGNMGGYQLDEVGLFGLTRCRTCACSGCGQRNFAGLNIEDIETYLTEHGHIVPQTTVKPRRGLPVVVATGEEADAGDSDMDEAAEGDSGDSADGGTEA